MLSKSIQTIFTSFMKNKLLGLILFLLAGAMHSLQAQVGYSSANFASVGDTFFLTRAQITNQNFSTAGGGVFWNFSSLSGVGQRRLIFRTAADAGASPLTWPYMLNSNNCNQTSTDGQSRILSGLGLTATDPNDFQKKTSSSFDQVGSSFKLVYNNVPITVRNQFDSPDKQIKFPIVFGDTSSSFSSFTTNILNGTWFQNQTLSRSNVVDGVGTVSLPTGTYSCFRLNSTVVQSDSIALGGVGTPRTNRVYRQLSWFSINKKYPVLIVVQSRVGNNWVNVSAEYLDVQQYFQPNAQFAATPIPGVTGQNMYFQNLSTNATDYFWNFGDGSPTSTEANPTHIFYQPGTYVVTLLASNPQSADTLTRMVQVNTPIVPIADFSFAPTNQDCGEIQFTNLSENGVSYIWNFGDSISIGNTSTQTNPKHRYSVAGTYLVKLVAINGQLRDSTFKLVTVNYPAPLSISLSTTTPIVQTGTPVLFTATALNADSLAQFAWYKNGVLKAWTFVPTYLDSFPGIGGQYQVVVRRDNFCGGIDTAYSNIVVVTVFNPDTTTIVARPIIAPGTGTYDNPMMVTMSCSTPNAEIYYTTNGNTPVPGTGFTRKYTGAFQVIQTSTVKAIGIRSGYTNSPIAISTLTITNPGIAATPVISPGTGSYAGMQMVSISSTTSGVSIYYTTNGNNPVIGTPNSFTRLYTAPFSINGTTTVKAMAIKSGIQNSLIATAVITITTPSPTVNTPVITPGTGSYAGPQLVGISTIFDGATIYYTTNGNVPVVGTGFTRLYTGPFTVSTSTTVRAIAVAPGAVNSAVAVAFITIGGGRAAVAELSGYRLFPNPSAETSRIYFEQTPSADTQVQLFDVQGKELSLEASWEDERTLRLNLQALKPGMYRIRVRNAQEQIWENLLKN